VTYTLRAINPDGSHAGLLPDCDSVQVNVAFSDVGSISFDYAVNGVSSSLVHDQREIAVFDEGEEVPDTRSVIEGGNGQLLAVEGVTYRSWTGRNMWKVLDESLVYGPNWPPTPPSDGKVSFASKTPGVVLATLFDKAKSLGELTGITRGFTGTADSNGAAWDNVLTIEYDMGISLLQVVQNLTDSGLAEFRMVGRELQAYNPGTLGSDLTVGGNPLVLWAGRNTTEAPEQTNSAGLRTVALVKGENGTWTEVEDPTARAQYGRRTMLVSQGGAGDVGTLSVIGQASLGQTSRIRSELTYKYLPGGGDNVASTGAWGMGPWGEFPWGGPSRTAAPAPMRDYIPGDWVFTDMTGELQRVRVRQILIEWSSDEPTAYTLVLNDKFLERDIALSRKVEGITGGASTNGGSMPSDSPGEDEIPPSPPTGLSASSDAYVDNQGHTFAQVSATWLAPTTNDDGTVLEDLDHYAVSWWYDRLAGSYRVDATDTSISWSPVLPGELIHLQVYAVDRSGNVSLPSSSISLTTGSDVTPPPVPSSPVLSTPFPGMVRIEWDGLGSAGETMPPDLKFVEVHWSAVDDFTPDASTVHDTLAVGSNISNATGLPYGQPVFVKFVSVDFTGNRSDPSGQASATPVKIGIDDVNFTAVDLGGGFHTYIGATDPSSDPDTVLQEGEIWVDTGNDNEPKRWDATASAWVSVRDQVEITEGRIAAGAVTAGKIAAGAIAAGSAIIGNAAISSAQIASLEAGKITAGTLVADITVSARIKTADTGARTELNNLGLLAYNASNTKVIDISSAGFKGYNSSGQLMVDISASGSGATITGTLRTAFSGQRIEVVPGAPHQINFYDAGGSFSGRLQSNASGSMQLISTSGTNITIGSSSASINAGSGSITINSTFGVLLSRAQVTGALSANGGLGVLGGAQFDGGNVTIGNGYRLNTDRIEASWTGFLRLEPSANVVSLVTYNNTYTASANMYVTSSGSYGRATSSERYKVNIDRTWSESADLEKIKSLKPASYYDRGDSERLAALLEAPFGPLPEGMDEFEAPRRLIGLIAEDVAELGLEDLLVRREDGSPDGVMYDRLAVMMLPWMHQLEDRLSALEISK
jgi:hypothetical protein